MIENVQIHLFYPLLFLTIITLIVTAGVVIAKKYNDNTFTNVFYKSNDNAKDITIHVTDNMKDMHSEVVKAEFTEQHEHELDYLEKTLQKISEDLTLLTTRVIKLEQERKQKN